MPICLIFTCLSWYAAAPNLHLLGFPGEYVVAYRSPIPTRTRGFLRYSGKQLIEQKKNCNYEGVFDNADEILVDESYSWKCDYGLLIGLISWYYNWGHENKGNEYTYIYQAHGEYFILSYAFLPDTTGLVKRSYSDDAFPPPGRALFFLHKNIAGRLKYVDSTGSGFHVHQYDVVSYWP